MDRSRLLRWTAITGSALIVLLGTAALGFWGGMEAHAAFSRNLQHQALIVDVEKLRVSISRLDEGHPDQAAGELNQQLDGQLGLLCVLSSGKSVDDHAQVVLRRVALQRRDHPPTYPAGWLERYPVLRDQQRNIQTCLAKALAAAPTAPGP